MSVSSVLKNAAHNFGQLSGGQKALRIGGTAVGATAVGLGLAACTPTPPKDPQTMAVDEFGEYDANGDDGVGSDEATLHWETDIYPRTTSNRIGDWVYSTTEQRRDTFDTSIEKLVRASKGNDAVASWQEIGNFALKRFDQDKDNMLDRGEVGNFIQEYGADKYNQRTEVLSTYDHLPDYDPIRRDTDNDPGWDPGWGGSDPGYDPGSGGSDPGTGPGTTPVDPNGEFDPDNGGGNDDGFGGSDEGN
ncbi:MAG: hypothetical protein JWM90_1021 [Thermoleophilia bacterium]|nr:hypothetical protein [Thermoleophilia bacterium]